MTKSLSLLLTLILLAFGMVLMNCGSGNHSVPPPTQTPQVASFLFMQEVTGISNVFTPMMGKFSVSGGNVTFSASALKDPSNGQPLEAEFYSITLGRDGKTGALELYGGPDGNSGQWDIWVGNITDGSLVQISNDTYEDKMPQLSPDGTKVVYVSSRPNPSNQWLIVVRNADGSGSEQVLPLPDGVQYEWHPAYSPDGSKIAFEAGGVDNTQTEFFGIWIMDANGGNPQMLTNPIFSEDCYTCYDQNPAFSSDGTKIAFSRVDERTYPGHEDIYIMNAAPGSSVTKLTDGAGFNSDPMFVTVGGSEKVLFSSNRDNLSMNSISGFELYSIKTDGTAFTRLTNNSLFDAFCAEYGLEEGPVGPSPTQHSLNQQHHTARAHWRH